MEVAEVVARGVLKRSHEGGAGALELTILIGWPIKTLSLVEGTDIRPKHKPDATKNSGQP